MDEHRLSRRKPPQVSLQFILMMTVVMAILLGGIGYMLQVPAVKNELRGLFPGAIPASEDESRLNHIVFIMFTVTAPLLLAIVLSSGMAIARWAGIGNPDDTGAPNR